MDLVRFLLISCAVGLLCGRVAPAASAANRESSYRRRVDEVRKTAGFVALWDFVKREDSLSGGRRFDAHKASGDSHDFRLDAVNYVREFWNQGRAATYDDFPLLGRGPFGQAVRLKRETDRGFRPCLLVPRERLHDSGLDVKGPNRSVSMVVWLIREGGNHALAGIWHEGTDLETAAGSVVRVERGRRQYALFAGLAANDGAAAAHISENGRSSFGDRYARNLAATKEVIRTVPADSPLDVLDRAWSVAGFSFDNAKNTVTAYLNGKAAEYWIENPESHPFYQWPYKGWVQAQLHRIPGLQPGEDSGFPTDQFYEPPETKPSSRTVIQETGDQRTELHVFPFTKVRVTLGKNAQGKFATLVDRKLVAIKANPFWFRHDIYSPPGPKDGGPFTIGRVIHSSRSVGFTGYIGGVAVFGRALSAKQMERLAAIGRDQPISVDR